MTIITANSIAWYQSYHVIKKLTKLIGGNDRVCGDGRKKSKPVYVIFLHRFALANFFKHAGGLIFKRKTKPVYSDEFLDWVHINGNYF